MASTSAAAAGIKVAIVGSGPSGFYCAARLLAAQNTVNVKVHMYERLPTPHGLVRYGVAPDHPEVKNVENKFATIGASPLFRFFGNVNIIGSTPSSGTDAAPSQASSSYSYPLATKVPFSALLPHYTHIILAYGSSLSRPLGIPGSEPGAFFNIHPALDFVNWYNGHPAAHDPEYLAANPWKKISLDGLQHATVVGAGNVALDVARILLRSSSTLNDLFQQDQAIKARASLSETDIPEEVLSQLSKSSVKHVDVVARRGPAQVAFTNKELREMMDLQDVHYQGVKAEDMDLARSQIAALEAASGGSDGAGLGEVRVRKRLLSILDKGSKAGNDSSVAWSTSFMQSPKQFKGKERAVSEVEWDEMTFKGQPAPEVQQGQPWSASALASNSGNQLVKTGKVKSTCTNLVITSVGYKGAPLDGSDPIQTNTGLIPWDSKRGIVPNRTGKVLGKNANAIPGLYVSGWLASGPVGVIASTRIDSNTVADQLLQDWLQSPSTSSISTAPQPGVPAQLKNTSLPVVSWSDWLRLDAEEIRRGKKAAKSREKVLSVREMLNIIA